MNPKKNPEMSQKKSQKMNPKTIPKILLIEDNRDIMKINRSTLTMHGYYILEAETMEQGREILKKENVDLIILDIMLPDGSGLDFCEELRRDSDIPILFLSALVKNQDIVNGLIKGGDDYLTKPYDLDVLVARVKALLRRVLRKPEPVITVDSMTLNTISQRVTVNGKDITLAPKEFAILLYLVQNEGHIAQAQQLYEAAWGQPMMDDPNAVRVAVSRLRKKIEPDGFKISIIRGLGYRFEK